MSEKKLIESKVNYEINGISYVIDIAVLNYIEELEKQKFKYKMLSQGWIIPKEGSMPGVGKDVEVWTDNEANPKQTAHCSSSNTWYYNSEELAVNVLFWLPS